jgi:hypothetical protein
MLAAGNGFEPPSRAVHTRALPIELPCRLFPLTWQFAALGSVPATLLLREIREVEIFASFRDCGPGITHSNVIFAFFRVSCFLCTHCAFGGCFPSCLAFAGHKLFLGCSAANSSMQFREPCSATIADAAMPGSPAGTLPTLNRKERPIRGDPNPASRSH